MDVRAPLVSLSPTLDMRVLTVLAGADVSFTSGDLARVTRASRSGVTLALQRLTHAGIVDVQTHGRTNAYRINRDHVLAETLVAAADSWAAVRRRAADLVAQWSIAPVQVTLFGSAARRDGDSDSDIDLLAIRPDTVSDDDPVWTRQLTDLQDSLQRWTGNPCEVLTMSRTQWLDAEASQAPIAAEVHRDGIRLYPAAGAA